jgi:hypothetical protein
LEMVIQERKIDCSSIVSGESSINPDIHIPLRFKSLEGVRILVYIYHDS